MIEPKRKEVEAHEPHHSKPKLHLLSDAKTIDTYDERLARRHLEDAVNYAEQSAMFFEQIEYCREESVSPQLMRLCDACARIAKATKENK